MLILLVFKISQILLVSRTLAQLKIMLTRIDLLLTPGNEHNKVFRDVPIIGFRRAESLKDILVREKMSQIINKQWCGPCKGPGCEISKHIAPTRKFTSCSTKCKHEIRPKNLNCGSKKVVYLISCKTCHKQSTGIQRNLGQGLIIIGVWIVTIVKTSKLNKSHFTLILQIVFIMVKVTGK